MATNKRTTTQSTRSFPNTPAGREKAIATAKKQGEPSITFKLSAPKQKKSK